MAKMERGSKNSMQINQHGDVQLCIDISPDLAYVVDAIYKPHGLIIAHVTKEPENQEYSACTFTLNGINIKFRAAHLTPKKAGQFVTLWKREGTGPIQPYDLSDVPEFFVISVRKRKQLGQFIFPKEILCKKGIVSRHGKGGKRAMRVYAPWDITESPQAKKTQAWQINYFLEMSSPSQVDHKRLKAFFKGNDG